MARCECEANGCSRVRGHKFAGCAEEAHTVNTTIYGTKLCNGCAQQHPAQYLKHTFTLNGSFVDYGVSGKSYRQDDRVCAFVYFRYLCSCADAWEPTDHGQAQSVRRQAARFAVEHGIAEKYIESVDPDDNLHQS